PGESAMYTAKAARALSLAGKDDQARELWKKLVDDPDAVSVQTEARVRLGELIAKPAGKS
ncbi:MAG TPA: hypothetical protein VKH19_06335, partial [Gemmatimonadaceae bacterium]|nr:hypothetical protein [Gemmatimonadaceae bacterium]